MFGRLGVLELFIIGVIFVFFFVVVKTLRR